MKRNVYLVCIPGGCHTYRVECTEREAVDDARLYARTHGTSAVVLDDLTREVVAIIPQQRKGVA